MPLDPIEERDGVHRTLLVRHPTALPPDRDDRAYTFSRAKVDEFAQPRLDFVVNLRVDDAVLERDGAGPRDQRR